MRAPTQSVASTFEDLQVFQRAYLKYIDQEMCATWRDEYRQIAKMLLGLYAAVGTSSDH